MRTHQRLKFGHQNKVLAEREFSLNQIPERIQPGFL
jgi:hypothetical protein